MSGIFYGISFVPMYIVQKNNVDAPDDGMLISNCVISNSNWVAVKFFGQRSETLACVKLIVYNGK